MVQRLAGDGAQGKASPRVRGGSRQHLQEQRLADVKAAARREQHSARRKESHRAQVDVLVAAECGVDCGAVLGESRRVEDDRVEGLATKLEIAEIVERVGFDERDVRETIALRVRFRPVQRIAGDVHRRYRFGTPGEVGREGAVIAEAVQRAPACDLADESPILALVEKGPRLLSGPWSREVSHAVLLDLDPLGYRAAQQLDAYRQLLFAAERDVVSGEDAVRLKQLLKHLDD